LSFSGSGGDGTPRVSLIEGIVETCFEGLDEHSQHGAVELALTRLRDEAARMANPVQREQLRDYAKKWVKQKQLGSAALVDVAVPKASASTAPADAQFGLNDPAPWPDAVDGAELLDDLASLFDRHAKLPEGGADAAALWTAFTYTIESSYVAPYLGITSATKRCGKTTMMGLIAAVVRKPLSASNITPAALYRSVDSFAPTLLIDEAETFLHGRDDLRGILNSGHTRSTAFVLRCAGDDFQPTLFSTWCAKAFGLIGRLPSTLEDRSIIIRMRRQITGAKAHRFNPQAMEPQLAELRSKLMRWSVDHLQLLAEADPEISESLHDRAADNWRPLLAIADAVGAGWGQRARQAAAALQLAAGAEDADASVLLLGDIRALFHEHAGPHSVHPGRLASSFIVTQLAAMEERPWPEWQYRQPMTAKQLAEALAPFDIAPRKVRFGHETARGYHADDFESAFRCYFQESERSEQEGTPEEQGGAEQPELRESRLLRELREGEWTGGDTN
jgi:hypothetical protein